MILTTLLPEEILSSLHNFSDVFFDDGDIPIVNLTISKNGTDFILDYFSNNGSNTITQILLIPSFGNPNNPYIEPNIQVEVFNLLTTFQSYDSKNNETLSYKNTQFPIRGGHKFCSNTGIYKLHNQIQNAQAFQNQCTGLISIPLGQTICDLTIIFSNAVIVLRCIRN